jgi:hypothetical protein
MSITTLDQLLAGQVGGSPFIKIMTVTPVAGQLYSTWTYGGFPSQLIGTAIPTGGVKGKFYTTVDGDTVGALRFPRPVAGDTIYLNRFSSTSTQLGTLFLADRIWADSCAIGPTITGANAALVFSGSFPRAIGIPGGDSSGDGIHLAMEVYTTLGAGTPTPKATVINSEGAGDTWTCVNTVPATAAAGTFVPMYGLKHSYGVRSVSQFHNFATHTSGVWGLTAYRIIARLGTFVANVENSVDPFQVSFPRILPNSSLFLLWMSNGTTGPFIVGSVRFAQG